MLIEFKIILFRYTFVYSYFWDSFANFSINIFSLLLALKSDHWHGRKTGGKILQRSQAVRVPGPPLQLHLFSVGYFPRYWRENASFQLLIITAVSPCLVITVIIIIIVNIVEFSCNNRILRALACTNPINPHTPKKLTCTFSHTFNHQIPPKFQSTPCCTQAHI